MDKEYYVDRKDQINTVKSFALTVEEIEESQLLTFVPRLKPAKLSLFNLESLSKVL